jgi:hypothetical protein
MPPEISYKPYFYYPRPDLVFPGLVIPGMVIPELVIPEHLKELVVEAQGTIRFDYEGFTPVIQDTLEAHIHRVGLLPKLFGI